MGVGAGGVRVVEELMGEWRRGHQQDKRGRRSWAAGPGLGDRMQFRGGQGPGAGPVWSPACPVLCSRIITTCR